MFGDLELISYFVTCDDYLLLIGNACVCFTRSSYIYIYLFN